jgi:hypothetical protein
MEEQLNEYLTDYRRAFIHFVKWYNKMQPKVTPEQKEAIKSLHSCFTDGHSDAFEAKKFHPIISGSESIGCAEPWINYLETGMFFRSYLMKCSAHKYNWDGLFK